MTAFSCGISLKIDGLDINADDIISVKLRREAENPPVKGIVSSEFVISLRTDNVFQPNASVIVRVDGEVPMNFSEHFISSIRRKGDIVTLSAFDRMKKTDIPFDISGLPVQEFYDGALTVGRLANQCGFSGASCPAGFGNLRRGDIEGKRAREVLDIIAEFMCGAWYCTDDNKLAFQPFLSKSSEVTVCREKSSPMYIHSVKGPITSLYAKNTSTGDVFIKGGGTDFRNVVRINGRLITDRRAGEIMSSIAQKNWHSFYCAHACIEAQPCGIAGFVFNMEFTGLIAVKYVLHFSPAGVYAELSTPDICEDEGDYMQLIDYSLRKKLDEGRSYGSTLISSKGLGIVDSVKTDDPREQQAYHFSDAVKGVSEFEGAIMDKILPSDIVRVSDTSRRLVYEGVSYLLSWEADDDGRKYGYRLEKEEE